MTDEQGPLGQDVQNLRNALDHIRLLASLHYLGLAFEPEHMRDIANIAVDALNGVEVPAIDYAGATTRALDFHQWMFSADEDAAPPELDEHG